LFNGNGKIRAADLTPPAVDALADVLYVGIARLIPAKDTGRAKMRTYTAGLTPRTKNINIGLSFLFLFLYHNNLNCKKVMPITISCQAFSGALPCKNSDGTGTPPSTISFVSQ
jgi:hypothetical protein